MFIALASDRNQLASFKTRQQVIDFLGYMSARTGRIYYAIDPEGKEIARTIRPKF